MSNYFPGTFAPADRGSSEEHDLPPTGRKIIAVGGSKGGVGKSLIASSFAVYLAQLGKRVVLVDADPTGANLHIPLGVERPKRLHIGETDSEVALIPTIVPGLRLLVAPLEASAQATLKASRKTRLINVLRTMVADDIVIDVGPGTSTSACDLFLAADVGVLVTVPEPQAIETTYRFVRALFARDLRRLARNDRMRLRTLDRLLGELDELPLPVELTRHLLRVEPPIGEIAAQVLARMRPRLVVNQTRVRTDLELGPWMSQVCERRMGIPLDSLGSVEHDDAVWLANRRRRPLLVDGPSSKAGRGLERVARRLVAVLPNRARELDAQGSVPKAPNYYERLLIQRGASEEEVRRAFKKQREIYASDGLPTISLFTEEELGREHSALEEAHDVLLDPNKRRAYDVSVFPDHAAGPPPPSPAERAKSEGKLAELVSLQAELARELGPDTEFSGALLRRVRESRGMDVKEIAAHTKISHQHVSAIEAEAFEALPPLVYVRGFLSEIAKFLKLDPSQVSRTYLRRARDLLDIRPTRE